MNSLRTIQQDRVISTLIPDRLYMHGGHPRFSDIDLSSLSYKDWYDGLFFEFSKVTFNKSFTAALVHMTSGSTWNPRVGGYADYVLEREAKSEQWVIAGCKGGGSFH